MVVIVAVYSKKIGLPAYSSHSYSVSLTSEVADLSAVERESAKLYAILQGSVDRELENPGLVPDGNSHGSTAPAPATVMGRTNPAPTAMPANPTVTSGTVRTNSAI